MANEKVVVLKKKGPTPEIEFVIGRNQWGSYKLKLFTEHASVWEDLKEGVNWDTVEDRFSIGRTPAKLHGAHLRWSIIITPVQVGDPYQVQVNIYQGGAVVEGGSIEHRGNTLLETHPTGGMVKVVAV